MDQLLIALPTALYIAIIALGYCYVYRGSSTGSNVRQRCVAAGRKPTRNFNVPDSLRVVIHSLRHLYVTAPIFKSCGESNPLL